MDDVKNAAESVAVTPLKPETMSHMEYKIFNDPIHGHIELHPLLVKIIDTPQFQRLRKLQQLGGVYFVYPGASHNRFEHCIGTCHLAGKLIKHIARQKDFEKEELKHLKPTEKDILCVEIAGLCHDLGHGPFSHAFDSRFAEKIRRTDVKHEDLSKALFDRMIATNELKEDKCYKQANLNDNDLDFIKDLIKPKESKNEPNPTATSDIEKRHEDQRRAYMREIISNEISGVDVDKWDYFARDCHHLGIKNNFDHNRFMALIKVMKAPQQNENGGSAYHLCVRDKESKNLYEMFHTRDFLHRRAYQHPVAKAVEEMICDAMFKANKFIKFKGEDGKEKSISETLDDMHAYEQLNDSVLDLIMHADSSGEGKEDLVEAKNILQNLMKRKMYTLVGQLSVKPKKDITRQNLKELPKECEMRVRRIIGNGLKCDEDYFVQITKFDYGMKHEDPVTKYLFYRKNESTPFRLKRKDVSHMLPENFLEYKISVYGKNPKSTKWLKDNRDGDAGWIKELEKDLKNDDNIEVD